MVDCNSKERSIILRSTKGDNDRTIYPAQAVWDLIKIYWNLWRKKPTDKYLFDGAKTGLPYTKESIRGFVKMHCKATGVAYKKVHAFRRYAITWSAENGVPLNIIAEKAGHSSTRTIERHYLYHSSSYLKSVVSPLQANKM